MKWHLSIISLIIVAGLVGGCAGPSKVMKSWMGSHVSDLYLSWGPPTSTTSDGKGGQIVSYYLNRDFGQIPGTAHTNYDGSISYTAPKNITYTAVRSFWIDKNGNIYNWRWKGL